VRLTNLYHPVASLDEGMSCFRDAFNVFDVPEAQ
jgi:hypothetical protein